MTNRVWRIARRPEGTDFSSALDLVEEERAPLGPGEIRIANRMLSMDAGTRLWLTDREDGYQPPLAIGAPMTGLVLGEVEESRAAGFSPGDLVRAFGTWSDESTLDAAAAGAVILDPGVADRRAWFGPLGMNGWTALWGIAETGAAKPGDRVIVSAAAGATGLLAVQIAGLLGCEVWGIAGGPEKGALLTDQFGLAGSVDHRGDVAAQLDDACSGPGENPGFDLYFDNVGGPLLDHVIARMNHYGRIAICGLIADYGSGTRTAPREFDQILMRRLRVEGFFSPDFMDQGARLTARLKDWLEEGKLTMPYDMTHGLEHTLDAYRKLFTGANIGKVIVDLEA